MSDVIGKATLQFAADGSSVKSEVREIGQEVNNLAATAAAASVKAAGSLTGIGAAGEAATQKLNASQLRARQSLERMAATLGKSRAEVAEYRAAAAGLPREVYEPLVAKIREAEAAMGSMAAAQRSAAATGAQLAESESAAAVRFKGVAAAAIERAAALQRQVEGARAAAAAERDLASATGGVRANPLGTLAGQNRGFQELTRDINEVNAALAAIERGAGSQQAIQAQTEKLVSLWGQGRLTAEQYAAAVKRLDASEASLARASAQAAAQGDRFIAGLREQAETAGMTGRQLLEYRAAQLGVADRAGPLIARLAQVNKSLDGTGISARQTAAALRMVPAQMTDIVTQLAGGQNPFLILIQQGGQLKDSFGGIGPMFRALLGMITPFAVTVGGLAAALGAVGLAAYQSSKETRQLELALASTNGYAGRTGAQLLEVARGASALHSTTGRAASALAQLVSSGKVAGAGLEGVTAAIVNMNEAGGRSVDSMVSEFARLADEPSQAIAKLNESMHFLDLATYQRIRSLEQQGQKEQAAALAQSTYATALNNAADRVRASAGTLERAWDTLSLAARRAWDSMLNIGRPTPISELRKQAEGLKALLEDTEKNQGFRSTEGGAAVGGGVSANRRARQRAATELAALEQEIAKRERDEAGARGEALKGQATQERIAAEQRLADMRKAMRDRQQIRDDEIAALKRDAAILGWTEKQVSDAVAKINEKYKEPKGAAAKDGAGARMLADLREREASLQAQLASEKKLTDAGKARAEFERQIADLKGKAILTADQQSLLSNQDAIRAQLEKNEALAKELVTKQELLRLEERAAQIQQAMTSAGESRRVQYDRQLATVGLGQQARERAEAERSIRQEFRRYEDQLAKATPKDQLGSEQYREAQSKIREALEGALADHRAYYAQLDFLNGNWRAGYSEAWADYQAQARNIAQQSQGVFANAFKGMEDALVSFATTSKRKFSEFAASVIADLARIAARQAAVGMIGSLVGMLGSGIAAGPSYAGSGQAAVGSTQGMSGQWGRVVGGRAIGGPVSARGMYEVTERGEPETLKTGGKQFLLMGSKSGYVSPLAAAPAGRAASGAAIAPIINVSVTVSRDGQDSNVSSNEQAGKAMGEAIAATVRDQIALSWRQGGISYNSSRAMQGR